MQHYSAFIKLVWLSSCKVRYIVLQEPTNFLLPTRSFSLRLFLPLLQGLWNKDVRDGPGRQWLSRSGAVVMEGTWRGGSLKEGTTTTTTGKDEEK